MADPDAKVPFSMAPHGAVKRINKRTASGGSIPYYTFISKGKRTYSVEIPVSMVKDARSKDEWVTLFACYGKDSQGQADVRATGNPAFDPYFSWAAQRAATQAQAVAVTHQKLNRVVGKADQWAVIHRQAKTNNDKLEAQAAWARIAVAKSDMSKLLKQLASEKLKLANIYKDNGSYEQARQQYLQIASLDVPPYSREAIAKLRVIEGDAMKVAHGIEGPYHIVSNLPYNVGTALFTGWLSGEDWPPVWQSLTLMFQQEVWTIPAGEMVDGLLKQVHLCANS
mgnify:CR=1 FL=1